MTEYCRCVVMAVPLADLEQASADARRFDAEGGEHSFTVPLSADGAEPATHYGCCVSMREATYQAVSALVAQAYPGGVLAECSVDGDGPTPTEAFAAAGLVRVVPPSPEEE